MRPFENYDNLEVHQQFWPNLFFFFTYPAIRCSSFCCNWRDLSHGRLGRNTSRSRITIIQTQYDHESAEEGVLGESSSSETDLLMKPRKTHQKSETRLRAAGVANEIDNFVNSHHVTINNERYPLESSRLSEQEAEEEEDTSFVLSALTESRDSLKMLVSSG